MIYDCFTFFNELDLLEIRLNILDATVDRFVLVEATRTHRMQNKPLFFNDNKGRFEKFLHKIEHIVVDDYPTWFSKLRQPRPWDYENRQRNAIVRGLTRCSAADVIIVSDLDEIPRPEVITLFQDAPGIKIFQQRQYYYYLNYHVHDPNDSDPASNITWNGSMMVKFRDLRSPQKLRDVRLREDKPDRIKIPNGGWHYSWLGGTDKVIEKLHTVCHLEYLNIDGLYEPQRVEAAIKAGRDILDRPDQVMHFEPLEAHSHEFVVANAERYRHLVVR